MATVPTTSTDSPPIRPYVGPDAGINPVGEIVFSGLEVIPGKSAANESEWTLTLNFPLNFAYRLIYACVDGIASGESEFVDWAPAQRVTVSSAREEDFSFEMRGAGYVGTPDAESFPITPAGLLTNARFFTPPYLPGQILVDPTLALRWMDVSTDTSTDMEARWRFRAHVFSIEQAARFGIHLSQPVVTP